MKLKSTLLLLMLASPLMLLSAIPVSAQPPPFISNAFIVLTLGNPLARGPATSTIIGMGPPWWPFVPPPINIVFYGEYEYLSTSGPPNPGPNPGMVPLFGPGVNRTVPPGGYGATWYSVVIGPVTVAGVLVTVIKTVRLPPVGAASWGWAQLDYQIIPNATIPQLWLYYSIDYNDGPVYYCPNSVLSDIASYYDYQPLVWHKLSIQPPPVPMPTPPGGGIIVDTLGSSWGFMGSFNWSYNGSQFIPASTFNVWRYCGRANDALFPDWFGWPIGIDISREGTTGGLSVNLTAVSPAGVRCNQLYIGGIWARPQIPQILHEPPIPPVSLAACFQFKDPWFTPQILVNVSEHSVRRVCPIAGRPVTFDASSSFDLNQTHTIIAYEWDFGDGTSPFNTTVPTIEHTYPNLGHNYEVNVTLTVYNNVDETAHARGRMIIAPPSGVDDVAVTNVVSSKTVVGQGFSASINVTVVNQGNYTENFNVTVYANTTIVDTLFTNITLTSGNSTTVTFTWNTTGFAKGNYTIWAYAWPVLGEAHTADNTFTDGWVIVSIVGDITGPNGWPDGKCDMRDIRAVAKLFGINYPDPKYNPNYDTNDDLKIDMKDIRTAAKQFGKTDP